MSSLLFRQSGISKKGQSLVEILKITVMCEEAIWNYCIEVPNFVIDYKIVVDLK